jgi:hypothetical protein
VGGCTFKRGAFENEFQRERLMAIGPICGRGFAGRLLILQPLNIPLKAYRKLDMDSIWSMLPPKG